MSSNIKKQQGAVLIITLVVLVVITLISVSELNQAGQQVKMINNVQQRDLSFQAAESAMSQAMELINTQATNNDENIQAMATVANGAIGSKVTVINNDMSDGDMNASVTYSTIKSNSLASGISLDVSDNSTNIPSVIFIATSTATIASSGATSTVVQGFTYE